MSKRSLNQQGGRSSEPSKKVKFDEAPQHHEAATGGGGSDDDTYDTELIDAEGLSNKRRRGLKELDDDSDEETNEAKKKPERKSKLLNSRDIQGQEQTGMDFEEGQKLEPFNMQEEFEEGDFDDSGFYTLKKTAKDSHDPWLDNLSHEEIQKAKEAQEKRLAREKNEVEAKPVNRITLMKQVIEILQAGETTIRALKRLGGSKPQPPKKKQDKKEEKPATKDSKGFDLLTEASYQLMSLGFSEIYSFTREQLQSQLEQESGESSRSQKGKDKQAPEPVPAATSSVPLGDAVTWHYKWTEDGEVYGPFTSQQMDAWAEEGMFGGGILVRKSGATEFLPSKRIDFSLYIDD